MSDLRRWVDDPEAASELKQALKHSAEVSPVDFDTEGGLKRFRAAALAATTASAAAAPAAAASAKAGWLLGGVLFVGAIVGGVVYQQRADEDPAVTREQASASPMAGHTEGSLPAGREPSVPDVPPIAIAPAEPVEVSPTAPVIDPPTQVRPPSRARNAPTLAAMERSSPEASAGALRAETLHLARVREALDRAPGDALRLAREGQRLFPDGVFSEEREAHVVFALDRLGRREAAREEAERFIARHPRGPLTARVRTILENL